MDMRGQDQAGLLGGSEITHFSGILPPERCLAGGRPHTPPNPSSPGGMILTALHPLTGHLDAALARGDHEAALRMAYAALSKVVDGLARARGDRWQGAQARVHALFVELEPLPYEVLMDGTLRERGTAVRVSYRNWAVDPKEIDYWARGLGARLASLWPGAWIVLGPTVSGSGSGDR